VLASVLPKTHFLSLHFASSLVNSIVLADSQYCLPPSLPPSSFASPRETHDCTVRCRVGVLLRRPAPIITSFLGYPSTSGNLDDSIISDMWVTPPETKALYTEKFVYLPHSYFVNDHRQLYPRPFKDSPVRSDHGLPDNRVVLGNFGQLYKVSRS